MIMMLAYYMGETPKLVQTFISPFFAIYDGRVRRFSFASP